MTVINNKAHSMDYEIDTNTWHICKICGKTIKELSKLYGGSGVYKTEIFRTHLRIDHNLTDIQYFTNNNILPPNCYCGICNQKVSLSIKPSSKFRWKKYECGRTEGTLKWSLQAKESRRGPNNPMYGKVPWNKGLDINHPSIAKISEASRGKKTSEQTKLKQSESARKRKIHGHTGHKHSEVTKLKLRYNTLSLIKKGVFTQTKSKPHIEFGKILNSININYIEEYIIEYWSFDYFLPDYNVCIEVDGDYFHSNPKIYPNGPKTNTQKINFHRDKKKNRYCTENNIKLLRFWECDILNDKERVICTLRELLE